MASFIVNLCGQVSKISVVTLQILGVKLQNCVALFLLLGLGHHLGPPSLAVYFLVLSHSH
jgi:hypothetical protein